MWKWVSWVIRMGATALLLSFLCIWTTGYIVNSYVESVVKDLDLPIKTEPLALSGLWGTLWGADHGAKTAEEQAAGEKAAQQDAAAGTDADIGTDKDAANTGAARETSGAVSRGDEESSVDGSGDGSSEAGAEPAGEEDSLPAMGGDIGVGGTAEELAGNLSDEQRQQLFSIVVSRLNSAQLQQLSDALEGGLDAKELSDLEKMLKSALTEQQYAQMMELLGGGAADEGTTGAVSGENSGGTPPSDGVEQIAGQAME